MDYNSILTGVFIIIILFVLVKVLAGPIKAFLRLLYSCVISTVGIFGFNLLGGFVGLHIGMNLLTILTVALLGIPGVALILILQVVFAV